MFDVGNELVLSDTVGALGVFPVLAEPRVVLFLRLFASKFFTFHAVNAFSSIAVVAFGFLLLLRLFFFRLFSTLLRG